MSDATGTVPNEPPTTLITAAEPPTTPMTTGLAESPDEQSVRAEVAADGDRPAAGDAPAAPRPVWPGLSAAGLPTRVPRDGGDDDIKDAFTQSWEAAPTGPTPLTQPPFVPTFPTQPSRRTSWSTGFDPTGAEPPEPKEPPQPVEPPEPRQPPEPASPPAPPTPPGPTPFPTPTPSPTPPEPVPAPAPPGPVPVPPPAPPVPTPPPPFPTPPGPVPPPPSIVPGRAAAASSGSRAGALYPSGTYRELATEPITGVAAQTRRGHEFSGTLAGHLATRGEDRFRRRERRRRLRTVLWVTGTLLVFAIGIVIVVDILAGDFIRSLFDTFAGFAG